MKVKYKGKGRPREPLLKGKRFYPCPKKSHSEWVEGFFYYPATKSIYTYHCCYFCRMVREDSLRKFFYTWNKYDHQAMINDMINDKIIWIPKENPDSGESWYNHHKP